MATSVRADTRLLDNGPPATARIASTQCRWSGLLCGQPAVRAAPPKCDGLEQETPQRMYKDVEPLIRRAIQKRALSQEVGLPCHRDRAGYANEGRQ